jgi:hypothetical protein
MSNKVQGGKPDSEFCIRVVMCWLIAYTVLRLPMVAVEITYLGLFFAGYFGVLW